MYKLIFTGFLILFSNSFSFAQQDSSSIIDDTDAYFPGCGNTDSNLAERKRCSGRSLFAYLYQQVGMPMAAIKNSQTSRIYLSFKVEKDGRVSNIRITNKSNSLELGDAVLLAAASMNRLPQAWTPATKKGKPIAATINVPLFFDLTQ